MVDVKYANAMSEVLVYLKGIRQEDIDKIPKKLIALLVFVVMLTFNNASGDIIMDINAPNNNANSQQNIIRPVEIIGEDNKSAENSVFQSETIDDSLISTVAYNDDFDNDQVKSTANVYYLCGWKNAGKSLNNEMNRIRKTLIKLNPNYDYRIIQWSWECGTDPKFFEQSAEYKKAVQNANIEGGNLARAIKNLSKNEQQKVILIGHSLGARVVIKAMALLNQWDVKINCAIVMGAAIDSDDSDIFFALRCAKIISLIHPQDGALMMASIIELSDATSEAFEYYNRGLYVEAAKAFFNQKFLVDAKPQLGLGSLSSRTNLIELLIAKNEKCDLTEMAALMKYKENHDFQTFLSAWERIVFNNDYINEIIIPQAAPNIKQEVLDFRWWWSVEKEFTDSQNLSWTLQKHRTSARYSRIVCTSGGTSIRYANGDIKYMEEAFERIKAQRQ